MGKNAVVSIDYEGLTVFFTEDAWFNATPVADRFGKRVVDWLENQETQAYIEAMARYLNLPNSAHLIRTKRGRNGGTWLHPKLGIAFARWLLPDFGVWLDVKIDSLLKGQHPHFDWKRQRHEAASSFKVMNDILATVRADQGKPTASHHYINEARLVNWALAGEFKGMDRDALPTPELTLLAKLELKNATLIGRDVGYADRKKILESLALEARVVPFPVLEPASCP